MSKTSKTFHDFYPYGRTEFEFIVEDVEKLTASGQSSTYHSTGDVDWHLHASLKNKDGKEMLGAFLYCDAVDVASWWKVNAQLRVVLVNLKNEKQSIARQMDYCFECEANENRGWGDMALYDDVIDKDLGFMSEDGFVKLRVMVGINSVEGFDTPKYFNFTVSDPQFSDATICVGDFKFHVNKMIISVHSEVLSKLLASKTEIVLDDVNPQDFSDLLQLLYAVPLRICKTNVSTILKLSNRFETNGLKLSCEQYLDYAEKCGDMTLEEVVKVAEANSLEKIIRNSIGSLKSAEEMKMKFPNYEKLSVDTLKVIINKSYEFA